MSYCAIITFKDGKAKDAIEYRNAWGGAARIWNALFDKYLKNPSIPYHTWICPRGTQALWGLAKNKMIPIFERAIHVSTFDLAYIRRENFTKHCGYLRKFDETYPVCGQVNHLKTWADKIETLDCEAIGFHGTSVAENSWINWDEEKDGSEKVPLSEGFEVYEWLGDVSSKEENS